MRCQRAGRVQRGPGKWALCRSVDPAPRILGASSVNTITFNGNGETLEHSPSVTGDRAAILLDGADFVTIDDLGDDVDEDLRLRQSVSSQGRSAQRIFFIVSCSNDRNCCPNHPSHYGHWTAEAAA